MTGKKDGRFETNNNPWFIQCHQIMQKALATAFAGSSYLSFQGNFVLSLKLPTHPPFPAAAVAVAHYALRFIE